MTYALDRQTNEHRTQHNKNVRLTWNNKTKNNKQHAHFNWFSRLIWERKWIQTHVVTFIAMNWVKNEYIYRLTNRVRSTKYSMNINNLEIVVNAAITNVNGKYLVLLNRKLRLDMEIDSCVLSMCIEQREFIVVLVTFHAIQRRIVCIRRGVN